MGLSSCNLELLKMIWLVARWVSGPFVVMGHFSMTLGELSEAVFPRACLRPVFDWEPVTTAIPPGRSIDHIFVSPGLLPSLSYPRLTLEGWSPHYMLRVNLAAKPLPLQGDRLVTPEALPQALPGAPCTDAPACLQRWHTCLETACVQFPTKYGDAPGHSDTVHAQFTLASEFSCFALD